MRGSKIILLMCILVFASCSKVIKTAQHAEVSTNVSSYPTVGDLHIASQRVSKTVSWKWNPFNTTSLKARKSNIKADLIKEAGADLLVEPEFVQKTSFCNLLGGSLTVSGYPATIDNFRTATPQDIVALRVAGSMKGKDPDDKVFIVVDQEDINGLVIGMSPKSSNSATVNQKSTDSVENVQESESPVVTTTVNVDSPGVNMADSNENVIPGDAVTETPVDNSNSTTAQTRVGRLTGRHNNRNRLASRLSRANTTSVGQSDANSSTGSVKMNANESAPSASSSNAPSTVVSSSTTSSVTSSVTSYEPIAYDKIAKDRYLVTMARNYYGDPNFWPYIYEENRVKFGHPDKIRIGSSVVIPNLKKYGVDPKNPADVEKAKKLAKEIYARFGADN